MIADTEVPVALFDLDDALFDRAGIYHKWADEFVGEALRSGPGGMVHSSRPGRIRPKAPTLGRGSGALRAHGIP